MRIRSVVAIGVMLLPLLPDALDAQRRLRLPRIGRRPAPPTQLPPQPPEVARALAYRRLPVSMEDYTLISRAEAPAFPGSAAMVRSTTFGAGTRIDYRMHRYVSATLDLTSSFIGGSSRNQTLEVGTRLRPQRTDRRLYPFVDLRAGYVMAYDSQFGQIDPGDPSGGTVGYGSRYSRGLGGVGGAGMEIGLTRSLSAITSASVLRGRMTTYRLNGAAPTDYRYWSTTYRYMLGLRWNPTRAIRPPGALGAEAR